MALRTTNSFKIKYNKLTFLYFIKIQRCKFIFKRHKSFLSFNEFKFISKGIYRKIKFTPLIFYNYINHNDIQFSIDPFVSQLTKNNYIHIDIYNIHQLDHKDPF